jgi:hypothetical protein
MLSILTSRIVNSRALRADLLIVVCLVALDVAARLLPHVPDFTPIVATALFAASVLRVRALALLVPTAGMMLGDAILGSYDSRMMIIVYAALALPACAAFLPSRLRGPRLIAALLLSSSLTFFVVTNFAVWAFSPMYAPNAAGLFKCYVAALPFLRNMIAGDLFWGLALFGLHWLAQVVRAAESERLIIRSTARL